MKILIIFSFVLSYFGSLALREKMNNNPPALQVFTYAEIRAATHDFSVENKLGEGGFGPVYKVIVGFQLIIL